MSLRINQNIAAFNSYRNLSVTGDMLSKSLEKLSSGFRINRAADDAAGLSISEGLRSQIGGLKVAVRNAQDGISVVQTAEGAMNEVHSILQRMRDLAVQASNSGSQDSDAVSAAQAEIVALQAEVDRIGSTTRFGGQNLLDGSFGVTKASFQTGLATPANFNIAADQDFTVSFSAGAGANLNAAGAIAIDVAAVSNATAADAARYLQQTISNAFAGFTNGNAAQETAVRALATEVTVTGTTGGGTSNFVIEIGGLADTGTFTVGDGAAAGNINTVIGALGASSAVAGTGGRFQIGANAGENLDVQIDAVSATALGINTVDLTTDASGAITLVDTAIGTVSSTRAELGAVQNRLEKTINNLNVAVENLSASESRIRDTDMALEMVAFTRSQILQQAGTAMLAQANQVPQGVLQLLR